MLARRSLYHRLRLHLRRLVHSSSSATLIPQRVDSFAAYQERQRALAGEFARRAAVERELAAAGEVLSIAGHCSVCRADVRFHTDMSYALSGPDGRLLPNWRERVVCPRCLLNNRMRAAIHFFQTICRPRSEGILYLTEQTTPLFAWFKEHHPNVVGSEYLGNSIPFGTEDAKGIRNESLTRLTFPDQVFDHVLSFDVFEHIPDYESAFRECFRCLRPGGSMLFTVPFAHGSPTNIVRATIGDNGQVVHLLPPEYHGDPLRAAGCLCFYHFGWEMLEHLRTAGFADAAAYFYWSRELGYLGGDQLLFMATKGAEPSALEGTGTLPPDP